MIYLVIYKVGESEDTKLAQIEAEDIREAWENTESIFSELGVVRSRKHTLLDVVPLNDVRKLDIFSS